MDYNICRLCLIPKRTDHLKFKNIFTTFENFNNREIKIIDAIVECAPIQIKENDNFPKDICLNCLEKLQNSYEFREICVQSDLKLKSLSVIKKQEPADNGSDLSDSNHKYDDLYEQENEKIIKEELIIEEEFGIAQHFLTQDSKSIDIKNENSFDDGMETTIQNNENLLKQGKKFICKLCEKSFTTSSSLNNHLRIHTGEKPYKCEFCNKSFRQKIHLTIHRRIHTGEYNYVCDLCPQSFSTNTCLTNHKNETHQESNDGSKKSVASFQCSSCGKSFKQKRYLRVHIKKGHTEDKRHICEICSEIFRTKLNLKRHMTIHKEKPAIKTGDRSPFTCNSCGKGFISKQEHSEHIRLHAEEYPFVCDTCGDLFKTWDYLRKHILLKHTEDKAHHCTICSKEFSRKDQLRLHLAVHNDDLPHKCGLCPKRFKWRVGLWRHEMRHTGDRPYKCSVCNKGFIEGGALRRHLRVHTGERPYKCELCFQSFKGPSNLTTHMKNVHKN